MAELEAMMTKSAKDQLNIDVYAQFEALILILTRTIDQFEALILILTRTIDQFEALILTRTIEPSLFLQPPLLLA